eukprot:6271541-Prymnesium_polylepis.1
MNELRVLSKRASSSVLSNLALPSEGPRPHHGASRPAAAQQPLFLPALPTLGSGSFSMLFGGGTPANGTAAGGGHRARTYRRRERAARARRRADAARG